MSFNLHTSDLAAYGITSNSPPTHALDLAGIQIHPIFRYANFIRPYAYRKLPFELRAPRDRYLAYQNVGEPLSQSTYNRCIPAFRLASLFLSHSTYFYYCLRNSPILETTGLRNRRKRYFQRISTWELTDVHSAITRQQLHDLAERVRFHVRPTADDSEFSALSTLSDDWFRAGPTDVRYFVQLKYAMDIIGSPTWPTLTAPKQIDILFKLAIDTSHEICHLLYWERFPNQISNPVNGHDIDLDPFWSLSEPRKEVGTAWEKWFFGMQVQPFPDDSITDINLPPSLGHSKPVHACLLTHMKASRVTSNTPFAQPDWFFASSASVQRMFDVNAWAAFDQFQQTPGLVDNPLQLALTPINIRSVKEMPNASGMSVFTGTDVMNRNNQFYEAFLQFCMLGKFNIAYDQNGDFAETSDSNSDVGNPAIN